MDNTNSISQGLFQSSEPMFPSSPISSSSDSGFFDSLKNVNMTTWLLIILILAFLGFNIFAFLAKGTQNIADVFGPITQKIFGTGVATAGQVVDVSAEGAKNVVSGTAGVINAGLTSVQTSLPSGQTVTPNQAPSGIKGQQLNQQQLNVMQQSTLDKALDSATHNDQFDYEAHEASSSVIGGASGKSGWCYIGDDRGFRSCAQVGVNDTCMSGDIFPSQEICMNPNLRS